ncbi:MAG: signal recognition particle-docking protein FtsY [Simkania sp.]|nr:signal recognition particle-docking protein FtsY [Simkania sp.]
MLGFLKSGFDKIKNALAKTRSLLAKKIQQLFSGKIDESTLEELEKILYEADLGTETAVDMTEIVRRFLRSHKEASSEAILSCLRDYALKLLNEPPKVLAPIPKPGEPRVILITGVNGSGKTTSIAKLARLFKKQGNVVLLAAADTFRAAAIEQLSIWAERIKVDLVKGQSGSDPAAVVFDALAAAKARHCDIVFIDTAGRLQNKTELMQELGKIQRVASKTIENAPHETWLVIDATTGQNALDQAIVFNSFTPLTGLIITKLDGSAKGGILLAIYRKLGVPILWVGIGEGDEDLTSFDPKHYVEALFDL